MRDGASWACAHLHIEKVLDRDQGSIKYWIEKVPDIQMTRTKTKSQIKNLRKYLVVAVNLENWKRRWKDRFFFDGQLKTRHDHMQIHGEKNYVARANKRKNEKSGMRNKSVNDINNDNDITIKILLIIITIIIIITMKQSRVVI